MPLSNPGPKAKPGSDASREGTTTPRSYSEVASANSADTFTTPVNPVTLVDQCVTDLETKIDLKFKDVSDQLTLLLDIIQPDVVDEAPPVLSNSESPSDNLLDDKKDDPSDVSSTTVEQKSVSFPDHLDPRISSRDPSTRPTIAQEAPSDGSVLGISNRETSNRLFNPMITRLVASPLVVVNHLSCIPSGIGKITSHTSCATRRMDINHLVLVINSI